MNALLVFAFIAGAALMAALAPVMLSVGSVFLFAGPHNWMEARYFVSRMPVRWAGLSNFFLTGIIGVVCLSAAFALTPHRPIWHTALLIWLVILTKLARPQWFDAILPIACLWGAFAWSAPGWADISLVYLHPLAAVWFLHRQVSRTHREWLPILRAAAAALPLFAAFVVFAQLGGLSPASTARAGLANLPDSPALVALHAFLELLHYGIWVALLPCIGLASAPWKFESIPLIRHRLGWPKLIRGTLIAGALAVVVLWACFAMDYSATRQIYFAIAVLHVLAEIPFLLWLR